MLTIWTSSEAFYVKDTVIKTLSFLACTPKYRCLSVEDFVPELEAGEVMLAMGTQALELLKAEGLVRKNRTLHSMRGSAIARGKGHILLTFDPYMTQTDASAELSIDWDTRLACRLEREGTLEPKTGVYVRVDDFSKTIEYIKAENAKAGKPVELAVDTETLGLDPFNSKAWIISLSVTSRPGQAEVVYFQKPSVTTTSLPWEPSLPVKLHEQITWLLNSPMISVRGANFKYDLVWIAEKWGITCSNFKFDTTLVGSLLNENVSNSLNAHAKMYTDMGGYDDAFNAKYDKSRMDLAPTEELVQYNGGDTDSCLQVSKSLKDKLLADPPLARFYVKLLHPAARAFEKLERRGILVDREKYAILQKDLEKEIARLEGVLLDQLPGRLRAKYVDKICGALEDDRSPFTASLLTEFFFGPLGLGLTPKMFTAKAQKPSTAYEHLIMFADVPEAKTFVSSLEELGSAKKTLSTYVIGFLKHLREDGRIHPTYMLFKGAQEGHEADDSAGTLTGRSAAKDPAWQTLPKLTKWAKRLRECFIAAKGQVFLSCDYEQGELKLSACAANEPTMLKAYREGLDLHAVTAAKLNSYELSEFLGLKISEADLFDELRQGGKAGNFGLIYGMGAAGFMNYARVTYGVIMTLLEAEAARNAFFDLYSGLPIWHTNVKQTARNQGYIRSPLGRVRHLPLIRSSDRGVRAKAERQAINSPIQSCLSDMCELAIERLEAKHGDQGLGLVGFTHDNTLAYVPEDDAEYWAKVVTDEMAGLPLEETFGWKPQLRFTADAQIGRDLAHMKKLKLVA